MTTTTTEPLPKIFVFCNGCEPSWHNMVALSADGRVLAGHACSSHGWAAHDMGINEDGWKRDKYAEHYPDGFEVVWVEDPSTHAGITEAIAILKAAAQAGLDVAPS